MVQKLLTAGRLSIPSLCVSFGGEQGRGQRNVLQRLKSPQRLTQGHQQCSTIRVKLFFIFFYFKHHKDMREDMHSPRDLDNSVSLYLSTQTHTLNFFFDPLPFFLPLSYTLWSSQPNVTSIPPLPPSNTLLWRGFLERSESSLH